MPPPLLVVEVVSPGIDNEKRIVSSVLPQLDLSAEDLLQAHRSV